MEVYKNTEGEYGNVIKIRKLEISEMGSRVFSVTNCKKGLTYLGKYAAAIGEMKCQ